MTPYDGEGSASRRTPLHHPRFAEIRAVDHAAVTEGMGGDDRRVAGYQVGRQTSRARADAETVAAVAGREIEAGHRVDGGDHRDAVGRRIDQATPHVRDLEALERGIVLAEPRQAELHQLRVGAGIERAMALE